MSAGTSAANNAGATFAVTVVVPIAIAKAADFNFGSFYSGSTPGTVHADADGKRSVSGGVLTADSGPTPTAAKFDVIGGASTTYTIYCPSGVTVTGPGAPMALPGSATSLAPAPPPLALAGLTLHPTRVVFEKNQRTTQVDLINNGSEPATYRISLVNRRMGEDGQFLGEGQGNRHRPHRPGRRLDPGDRTPRGSARQRQPVASRSHQKRRRVRAGAAI